MTAVHNMTQKEAESDSVTQLFAKHFGKEATKWDAKGVEVIFSKELVPSNFSNHKLSVLDYHHYMEKVLWPHYTAEASLNHVLSICLLVNEKSRQQKLSIWDAFGMDTEKFSTLFHRVTRLLTNAELTLSLQQHVLVFLDHCFRGLENKLVKKECLKYVSIGIWTDLAHESKRTSILQERADLAKLWNSRNKKLKAANEEAKEQLEYESSWLSGLMRDYIDLVYKIPAEGEVESDIIALSERYLEFFINLLTQIYTRRFFNTLLEDHALTVLSEMAPLMRRENKDVDHLQKLLTTLEFYHKFEVDDYNGSAVSYLDAMDVHTRKLKHLQLVAFKNFPKELELLCTANTSSIETRENMEWHLKPLSEAILVQLCDALSIRSSPVVITADVDTKEFLLNVLVERYEKHKSCREFINENPLYPDEHAIFNESPDGNQVYTNGRVMAIPKPGSQFLTLDDYLLRHFSLLRLSSANKIRHEIEDIVKRISPCLTFPEQKTEFGGWARMAVNIDSFNVVDIAEANLGEEQPARVRADVGFQLGRFTNVIRNEWDGLRKHDVLFLVSIQANESSTDELKEGQDFRQHFGIKSIRGAEIVDIIGKDDRPVDDNYRYNHGDENPYKGHDRTLRLELDPLQYKLDINSKEKSDIYQTFNILVRRKPQDNNFKAVLEAMRDALSTESNVPDWLQKVFFGFGDPSSAHYTKLSNRLKDIKLSDTFLDWDHFKEAFKHKNIQLATGEIEPLQPPFEITVLDDPMDTGSSKKSKKNAVVEAQETYQVSSYETPGKSPYEETIRQNQVRFTPTQAEAIYSGSNLGLTAVTGESGTLEVAIQTMANLYHNYSEQHTVVITENEQILDEVFERLQALDIDPVHLVRLGHGEKEMTSPYSKFGRISAALERRLSLLSEVDRLAKSLKINGEHGATCETAKYFYPVHVVPRWEAYIEKASQSQSLEDINDWFPFTAFFADAPKPIFTEAVDQTTAIKAAKDSYHYIEKLFKQLDEMRPFELLKSVQHRGNYVVSKAKIVAMTSATCSLKRRELLDIGFKYDNLIVVEAKDIPEIETFVSLSLQKTTNHLKRFVLIGQENTTKHSSMLARFEKLGVPTTKL